MWATASSCYKRRVLAGRGPRLEIRMKQAQGVAGSPSRLYPQPRAPEAGSVSSSPRRDGPAGSDRGRPGAFRLRLHGTQTPTAPPKQRNAEHTPVRNRLTDGAVTRWSLIVAVLALVFTGLGVAIAWL